MQKKEQEELKNEIENLMSEMAVTGPPKSKGSKSSTSKKSDASRKSKSKNR
jgi:hypothetical protein